MGPQIGKRPPATGSAGPAGQAAAGVRLPGCAVTSPESAEHEDVPRPADALPAAEHACARAVAHLQGRPARGSLPEAIVALLEAAGGPGVGNAARTHLERTGAAVPDRRPGDAPRLRVLLAAARLHAAAEQDLDERLRRAGLAGGAHAGRPAGPAMRAQHAERVLRARRAAVDHVLAALAARDLIGGGPAEDTVAQDAQTWVSALVGELPAALAREAASQGETGRGPASG